MTFEAERGRGETERQFYERALDDAEAGWQSTGYGAPINQTMRFDVVRDWLLKDEHDRSYTLLDVGCGTGDLFPYLYDAERCPAMYVGCDVMPEMIERAKLVHEKRVKDGSYPDHDISDVRFVDGDVTDVLTSRTALGVPDQYDYVTSIAAYALKSPETSQMEELVRVQDDIERMLLMAKKAASISLFSTWKTQIIPEEMVFDPVTVFAWAKAQWERVDLIHSYAPFDFTLVVWKEDSPWRKAYQAAQQ